MIFTSLWYWGLLPFILYLPLRRPLIPPLSIPSAPLCPILGAHILLDMSWSRRYVV